MNPHVASNCQNRGDNSCTAAFSGCHVRYVGGANTDDHDALVDDVEVFQHMKQRGRSEVGLAVK